jgi:hypothetical protein
MKTTRVYITDEDIEILKSVRDLLQDQVDNITASYTNDLVRDLDFMITDFNNELENEK